MDIKDYKKVRIGDVLKEYGYATDEQINEALQLSAANPGTRLGDALIQLGFITEKQLLQALGKRLSLRVVDISQLDIDLKATALIPRRVCEKYLLLAIGMTDGMLSAVMNDPTNFYGIEDVRQTTGMPLNIMLCEKLPLERAIKYCYTEIDAQKAAEKVNEQILQNIEESSVEDDETPVIEFVQSLIRRAYSAGASDIHIEPFEGFTSVRMRIDGVMIDFVTVQKDIRSSLTARIKILSEMDIAEKRLPQDGHFVFVYDDKTRINIRASIIPTVYGEKAVLRLLASNAAVDNGGTFGMNPDSFEKFSHMLSRPNGIIYITGPTGSGKSTTLYMVLAELSKKQVNISTIEDPVEKNMPKINQMQVNARAGLTFETGLRALLRQDPDIIMVGETRDNETASISVRAAITGHVVLSTLHTNDAVSSIARLLDMGVEPYLIADSLTGVVAQRLLRKLCPACSVEEPPTEQEKAVLGQDVKSVRRARGCRLCNYTGYRGRTAIHEVFVLDRTSRDMIARGESVDTIRDYARKMGMSSLLDCARSLVISGVTTCEELMKAVYSN